MKRLFFLFAFTLLLSFESYSQQLPLYTQYVFNPYMINPSMVAFSNRPEVNLLYRQQWINIQDGPKTLQFDFQLPINSKMSVGVNFNNDKTVLLSSTSALLTYGYKIQLAPEHQLGFGLSAGIYSNKLNLDEVAAADIPDPALLTSQNNSFVLDGQFGVHYKFKGFMLGYSLVNLLQRKGFSTTAFQDVKAGQLKNQILFASYRFSLVPDVFYLQPNVSYRLSQKDLNYYEASLITSYKNIIDVGGGYRQNFGPTVMLRVHFKRLQVGASYDFPSNTAQVSGGGTREIQLKWTFGPLNEPAKATKQNSTLPKNPEPEEVQPIIEEKPQDEAKVIKEETKPKVEEPVIITPPVEQKTATDEDFYYIIGAFENKANALHFLETVKKKGMKAELKESKLGRVPFYYYIHLPEYKTKEVGLDKVMELRKITKIDEAWFSKLN